MKKQIGTYIFGIIFLAAVFSLGYFFGEIQPSETATMVILNSSDPTDTIPETKWVPAYGPANRLNLNTAEADDLMKLPGIGQTLADRIIEYRKNHQKFESVEELLQVEGIGQAVFDDVRHMVTVGG